ncbi:MAG: hypothetical protein KKE20_04040 [Nanoarchaeota archaeon]|nr:hypothetical protein [Nanoarchaeota archaeon]
MQYTIYCDLHIGGPHEIKEPLTFSENTVFLGDNFDLKNSLRKNLPEIEAMRSSTILKCRRSGGIYITGNHSLQINDLSEIRDGVLFLHGDLVHKGLERAKKWRLSHKKGKSSFYWNILRMYYRLFHDPIFVLKRHIRKAYSLAKENSCHTIVLGHFHPRNLIDLKRDNIRIVILPRGVNQISL